MVYEYLAGLIDGDGSIELSWNSHDKLFRPRIRIEMYTNKALRTLLISQGFNNYKAQNHDVFQMDSKSKTGAFLKKVLPHLKLKKKQAQLLLEAEKYMPREKRGGCGKYAWKTVKKLVEIQEEMRKYNTRKGKVKWTKEKILEQFKGCRGG